MISHVAERALEAEILDSVIIAIDAEETKSAFSSYKFNMVMTDAKQSSGTDHVSQVARTIDQAKIIINIQGDEPKINPDIIDNLILLFNDPLVEMASVGSTDLNDDDLSNPNIVKTYLDKNNYAVDFQRAITARDKQYFRHIGIYAYPKEKLIKFTSLEQTQNEKILKLEQLRALDNNLAIKILITNFQHRSIDIEEDLKYYEV